MCKDHGHERHNCHNGETCVALDSIFNVNGKLEPKSNF